MLSKYTRASGEIYEVSEPSTSGSRTFTFSEPQDALWVVVGYGVESKGSVNWGYTYWHTMEIDGVEVSDLQNSGSRLLDMKAKEIVIDPNTAGLRTHSWCKIIGLRK